MNVLLYSQDAKRVCASLLFPLTLELHTRLHTNTHVQVHTVTRTGRYSCMTLWHTDCRHLSYAGHALFDYSQLYMLSGYKWLSSGPPPGTWQLAPLRWPYLLLPLQFVTHPPAHLTSSTIRCHCQVICQYRNDTCNKYDVMPTGATPSQTHTHTHAHTYMHTHKQAYAGLYACLCVFREKFH